MTKEEYVSALKFHKAEMKKHKKAMERLDPKRAKSYLGFVPSRNKKVDLRYEDGSLGTGLIKYYGVEDNGEVWVAVGDVTPDCHTTMDYEVIRKINKEG